MISNSCKKERSEEEMRIYFGDGLKRVRYG